MADYFDPASAAAATGEGGETLPAAAGAKGPSAANSGEDDFYKVSKSAKMQLEDGHPESEKKETLEEVAKVSVVQKKTKKKEEEMKKDSKTKNLALLVVFVLLLVLSLTILGILAAHQWLGVRFIPSLVPY